jgi:hypothetical protein
LFGDFQSVLNFFACCGVFGLSLFSFDKSSSGWVVFCALGKTNFSYDTPHRKLRREPPLPEQFQPLPDVLDKIAL